MNVLVYVFDSLRGDGTENKRDIKRARGFGNRQVGAVVYDRKDTYGSKQERNTEFLSENLHREVTLRDIAHNTRYYLPPSECFAVLPYRVFGTRPAFNVAVCFV